MFYKKIFRHLSKKWYPMSILVGTSVTTDQIAKRIASESTVSPADVKAVLEALSGVMGEYMAQGRSVRLDGIGSFFFKLSATGNGVDTEEEVSINQINGVKVRFIPETTFKRGGGRSMKGRKASRALTDVDIDWIDVSTLGITTDKEETDGDDENPNGGNTPGTSGLPEDNL